ncbi:MAG TPA: alpha/beta fold hydrolase [Clostridia bacterium]|nr:alpha/beta fold hydrolase [Clostridia bacterium]
MAFSLEVKKFINSENTGAYVDILLPAVEAARPARKAKAPAAQVPVEAAAAAAEAGEASAVQAQDEPAPTQIPAEPEAERETLRLHYLEAGEGEPLILVHTVGQSLYTWRGVFDRLSNYYRVIAIDLPGHGYSSRPDTFGYTIDDHAYALRAFMDEMRIQSAHFAAFSMGCAYVMRLAADAPERVGRMVLLSPGGVTPEMPLPIRLIDSPMLGFVASVLYNLRTVEKLLNDAVFDLTNITPEVVASYYSTVCDGASRKAVRMSLQYYDDESIVASLREIAAPVLILQGGEDKWHPAQHGAEIYHAALRNAASAVVRNAGHLMHEEKPERVVAAFLEFIPVVMGA